MYLSPLGAVRRRRNWNMGRQRLGINLISLVAALREEARLPWRTIQWYLDTVHGLRLSLGAIVDATRRVLPAQTELTGIRSARLPGGRARHDAQRHQRQATCRWSTTAPATPRMDHWHGGLTASTNSTGRPQPSDTPQRNNAAPPNFGTPPAGALPSLSA